MAKLALVAAIVFVLLLLAEYMWRIAKLHTEITRKFIHITVGTFVAFWPWILNWGQIELFSIVFLLAIVLARSITVLSRVFTIFGSVHIIGRKTVGELFFAMAIGGVALITHNQWVYMAAILHLSAADGLAAIVGTQFGKRFPYKVFGQSKTLLGTTTFFVVSVTIIAVYFHFSHAPEFWPTIIGLPLAATALENIGARGSDNLLVPLAVATVLQLV